MPHNNIYYITYNLRFTSFSPSIFRHLLDKTLLSSCATLRDVVLQIGEIRTCFAGMAWTEQQKRTTKRSKKGSKRTRYIVKPESTCLKPPLARYWKDWEGIYRYTSIPVTANTHHFESENHPSNVRIDTEHFGTRTITYIHFQQRTTWFTATKQAWSVPFCFSPRHCLTDIQQWHRSNWAAW